MQNYDTSSGLGANYHELAHGVDCPFHAAYLNTVAYMDRDSPLDHPNSICVWEQDTGSPLHRHYTQVSHWGPSLSKSSAAQAAKEFFSSKLAVAFAQEFFTINCLRGLQK